jgi:hypothetical protein
MNRKLIDVYCTDVASLVILPTLAPSHRRPQPSCLLGFISSTLRTNHCGGPMSSSFDPDQTVSEDEGGSRVLFLGPGVCVPHILLLAVGKG